MTELITLSLFGHRSLAEDAFGVTMLRTLVGEQSLLEVDSYGVGPEFERRPYTTKNLADVGVALRDHSDDYAVHLWNDRSQRAGHPAVMIRLAGRSQSFHQCMIEVPATLFTRNGVGDDLLRLAKTWLPELSLISGYMHDGDDFHFQNETNPEVFRLSGRSLRGYRLKSIFRSLKREIDVERNPGHWHFVNGQMFTVAWITYFGPELINLYGRTRIETAGWESVETIGGCIVGQLYRNPFDPEDPEKRRIQATVRHRMEVDKVAHSLLQPGNLVERLPMDFG